MRELRTFVGQFVIIAALIICVPMLLRKVGLTGTSGGILAFVLIGVLLFWTVTLRLRKRRRSIEDAAASFGFYPVDVSDCALPSTGYGFAIRKPLRISQKHLGRQRR
jgi:hypothetical protein